MTVGGAGDSAGGASCAYAGAEARKAIMAAAQRRFMTELLYFTSSNSTAIPEPRIFLVNSRGRGGRAHFLRHTGEVIHATTILAVRHQNRTVLAGDGQVTFGNTVLKQRARKIRRLYNESILAGFAGSAADSFALFSRFESKLEQYRGNLERAAVELARDWRADRLLRRLEAMLIVADKGSTFLLSGTGDLIEPDDGIVAVGSGGPYAMAAARALALHGQLDARQIAEAAMAIAADICIYTNPNLTIEEL